MYMYITINFTNPAITSATKYYKLITSRRCKWLVMNVHSKESFNIVTY